MKYKLEPLYNYNRHEMKFKIGDFVKLIFTSPSGIHGERMWVRITETHHVAKSQNPVNFTGVLDNESVYKYADLGEEINFTINEIAHFKRR